jgi:predicted dithiol-disulfide oxidoreductase (DUF899 family)
MSELRYPNESREYRDARDSLLKDEQELIDKVKSVAERRRNLPLGGQLKEDYVFQWANDGKVGKSVKFSELFADKNTLLLAHGPTASKPERNSQFTGGSSCGRRANSPSDLGPILRPDVPPKLLGNFAYPHLDCRPGRH